MKHTVCQLFVFVSILLFCALTLPAPGQTAAPAAAPAATEKAAPAEADQTILMEPADEELPFILEEIPTQEAN